MRRWLGSEPQAQTPEECSCRLLVVQAEQNEWWAPAEVKFGHAGFGKLRRLAAAIDDERQG